MCQSSHLSRCVCSLTRYSPLFKTGGLQAEPVVSYGRKSKRKHERRADSIENRGSLTPIAEVLPWNEEGWTHTPHSEVHISNFVLDWLSVPWPQPELLQLWKSGPFRYDWSILISELNLRKFQSTILPVHLHFGRCSWTKKKLGLVVWQKDWMQVDVEEPCCQMQ